MSHYDIGPTRHDAEMGAILTTQADARFAAAKLAWQRSDVVQAETILLDLSQHEPAREDVATLLAEVLRGQGRLGAAAAVMQALAGASGFDPGVALRAAAFARECDRHAAAVKICEGALTHGVKTPELLVLAGHVARESGDFEGARAHYLAALDAGIDPCRQNVLGALANTKRYIDPSDPDRVRCEAQFRDPAISPRARAATGYALAKILNDLGDIAGAVAILREANGTTHALDPWRPDSWQRFIAARQGERVAGLAGAPAAFAPVFIVGVPRSGTTLATTLLARATAARDRGELRALRFIAERLRGGGHLGNAAAVAEAAGLYRMLARQDDAPARVYLDQDPLNFRWLDIAAAMFPQVKVIHLRRDQRDTALSLWSQEFAHPDMRFSSDFTDIATFMRGHDALMAHWKRNLRIPIFELDYESLVTDSEGVVTKLAAFIEMPVLQTNDATHAPVTSASVWQARQAVYTTSMGRWRRYAPYVPELAAFTGSCR